MVQPAVPLAKRTVPAAVLTAPVPAVHHPDLPGVTLVSVTSVALEATASAMARSLDAARFGAAVWCSDQPPPLAIADRVAWHPIAPLTSRAAYSRFMLHDLVDHVATCHALCVQWDGYVLDPAAWQPAFLEYDYIGAVWPHFADGHRVGNGGFSLRSRRLLAACRELSARFTDLDVVEDQMICRTARVWLESERGIRFAAEDVARGFAFEREAKSGATFGFHGVFNLVALLDGATAAQTLAALEPHVLADSEHRELLRWAVAHRRWRLVAILLRRMLHRTAVRRA